MRTAVTQAQTPTKRARQEPGHPLSAAFSISDSDEDADAYEIKTTKTKARAERAAATRLSCRQLTITLCCQPERAPPSRQRAQDNGAHGKGQHHLPCEA
jgi:hypothetical protein